ncbi:hypothetical protein [Poseidonocella sp. HB161398]|uniref:hypothetical protein n=1 Tax=Poseidonocella sp. HB161398 TaxID=2320855 RepID=UPI0011095F36|nr:hypothetical protein [Poseidonocella sp. HB161398]
MTRHAVSRAAPRRLPLILPLSGGAGLASDAPDAGSLATRRRTPLRWRDRHVPAAAAGAVLLYMHAAAGPGAMVAPRNGSFFHASAATPGACAIFLAAAPGLRARQAAPERRVRADICASQRQRPFSARVSPVRPFLAPDPVPAGLPRPRFAACTALGRRPGLPGHAWLGGIFTGSRTPDPRPFFAPRPLLPPGPAASRMREAA